MACPHCGEKINICTSCAYSQEEEFIRCPNCGKIVQYCANCGTKLYVKPNKGKDREFDEAFSRVFGYNVDFDAKLCPKCGQEIGDAPFCPFCGNDLTDFGQGEIVDNDYEVVDNIYNYLDDPQYQYNPDIITDFFTNPLKYIFDILISVFIPQSESVQQVFPEFQEDKTCEAEKCRKKLVLRILKPHLKMSILNHRSKTLNKEISTLLIKSHQDGVYTSF